MKKINYLIIALVILFIGIAATTVPYSTLVSKLTVNERIVTGTVNMNIVHDQLNETVNYRDGSSKFDVDLVYADTVKGTQTIDLTSLENSLGETLSLSGHRVMAAKFKSRITNAGTIVISQGGTNPYTLFGATYSMTLEPGQSLLFQADTNAASVSATVKNILATCGSDTLDLILIASDL